MIALYWSANVHAFEREDDGSSTGKFVSAIQKLLDAPAIEDRTRARDMHTAEQYSWGSVATQTETVLAATIE